MSLSYPLLRIELLNWLDDSKSISRLTDITELEFIVHFFFDDHDFAPDPRAMIGLALFDDVEAALLGTFIDALTEYIGEGRSFPTLLKENAGQIAEAATVAYDLLSQRA